MRHDDHHRRAKDAEQEGVLEVLGDLSDFLKEGCVFELLCRGAPTHVDAKQMAEERLADVQRDSTQEDIKQWDPGKALEDTRENALGTSAETHDSQGHVTEGDKDDDERKVDL